MENKFRIEPEKVNQERGASLRQSSGQARTSRSSSDADGGPTLFSGIERRLKLENYFEEGFPVKYLPKILFVMFLVLLYISNTHYAEKTVRRIDQVQSDVEDLRADYTTLKSDLMFASKQSEVARKVRALGLKESLNPPTRVVTRE